MRILQFVPVYKPAWRYGGVVRCVSQLCEALSSQGVDVTVYTTDADGRRRLSVPTDRETDVEGVPTRYFRHVRTPWGIDSVDLRRYIHQLIAHFDLVNLASVWQPLGIVVANAARRRGVPYVNSLHGTINPWAWSRRKTKHHLYWHSFERRCLARAAALHVTSNQEQAEALTLGVGLGQKFIVVPNGLRVQDHRSDPSAATAFRKTLGIPPDRPIVLFLGRIHPKKGIDFFLRATLPVWRRNREWILTIVGPDEDGHRAQLEKLVRDCGIRGNVRFHDSISGRLRIGAYGAAAIFVLTSHNENFGMSVVEAMAAAVPVLISDQVGISPEIAADRAGVVVPLEEPAIRKALAELMASRDLRHTYAQRGLECVRRRYDIDVVAQRMSRAYQRILTGRIQV